MAAITIHNYIFTEQMLTNMLSVLSSIVDGEHNVSGGVSLAWEWRERNGCLVDAVGDVEKTPDDPFGAAAADALLSSYLRFSPDPIFVVDRDGQFVYSNEACRDLFDRVVGELIGTNLFEYDNADNSAMQEVLDTGEPLHGLDQEIVTDDGERISVERYLYPLFDASGGLVGGIEINRDVSERVSAQRREAQLEQLRAYQSDVAGQFEEWIGALSRGDFTIDPSVPKPDADFDDIRSVHEAFDAMATDLGVAADSTGEMLADVDRSVARLDSLSERLGAAADETGTAAASIDEDSADVAAMASEQVEKAAAAEESATDLSASIEEITSTTQQISAQASQARSVADAGTEAAETAGDRMDDAVERSERNLEQVRDLEAQMEEVEELADSIAGIADETNLLALNANIEAASSDGEGFGVVATEIKSLAEESKATVEEVSATLDSLREDVESTTETIERSSEEIRAGAAAVEEVVTHIDEMGQAIEETERGVAQIAEATDAQAENAQTVTTAVEAVTEQSRQVDDRMADISSQVDQQTESVENVQRVAETIDGLSSDLQADLDAFTLEAHDDT